MNKHSFLFALPLAALLFSCSAEENIAQDAVIKENINAYVETTGKSWENLNIEFSKLFDYDSAQKASEETARAYALIAKELQKELANRPGSDQGIIKFYLYMGRGTLGSVWFADSKKGIFTECIAMNSTCVRPYTHFIIDTSFYAQHIEFNKKRYSEIDCNDIDAKLQEFINANLEQPQGIAEFMVVVDATSSKLYGYNGQL